MPIITLKQLQKRTKYTLKSDLWAKCRTSEGLLSVREAERRTEARDSDHKELKEASIRHFLDKGLEVYPHGICVQESDILAMPDLAIVKDRRIILIECVTKYCATDEVITHKKAMEKYFPLWFVFKHPDKVWWGQFMKKDKPEYMQCLEHTGYTNRVLAWCGGKKLTVLFPKRPPSRPSST